MSEYLKPFRGPAASESPGELFKNRDSRTKAPEILTRYIQFSSQKYFPPCIS